MQNSNQVHKMNLQDLPFKLIDNESKTIEMRVNDEKRSKIKIGDIIEFNNNNTDKIIRTEVIELHKFRNFDELYNFFDKIKIGYSEEETANPNDMSQYYPREDIEKYGVVGIEIKKI